MRLKVFHTPKPKKFSFHTRYYEENKLSDKPSLEKGSFAKHKTRFNKFDKPDFDDNYGAVQKGSSFLYKTILYLVLLAVAILSLMYVKFGWIISVSILALVLAFSKRK